MNVVYSSQPVSIKFQLYFVQFNNNASHLIFNLKNGNGANMKLTENGSDDKMAALFL